jgi:hypothetical protein
METPQDFPIKSIKKLSKPLEAFPASSALPTIPKSSSKIFLSDASPSIPPNSKFKYEDFSFTSHRSDKDLDSYKPTQVLNIISGQTPPNLYRLGYYTKYMNSLSNSSFHNNSKFSKEYKDANAVRNNPSQLAYLKKKYLKYLSKPLKAPKIIQKIPVKRFSPKLAKISTVQSNPHFELMGEIERFEEKLKKIKEKTPGTRVPKIFYRV